MYSATLTRFAIRPIVSGRRVALVPACGRKDRRPPRAPPRPSHRRCASAALRPPSAPAAPRGKASDPRTGRSSPGRPCPSRRSRRASRSTASRRRVVRASSTRIRSCSSSTATRRSKHRSGQRTRLDARWHRSADRRAQGRRHRLCDDQLRRPHSQADAHRRRRAGDSRTRADYRHHQERQLCLRRAARSELAHRRRRAELPRRVRFAVLRADEAGRPADRASPAGAGSAGSGSDLVDRSRAGTSSSRPAACGGRCERWGRARRARWHSPRRPRRRRRSCSRRTRLSC